MFDIDFLMTYKPGGISYLNRPLERLARCLQESPECAIQVSCIINSTESWAAILNEPFLMVFALIKFAEILT
jgi:hypothetical protein